MSLTNSFFATVFLFVTFITSCIAQTTSQCVPSSCGDSGELKFPFRLRSDPQHCGKTGYELDCQNNVTITSCINSTRQKINYTNFSAKIALFFQNTGQVMMP